MGYDSVSVFVVHFSFGCSVSVLQEKSSGDGGCTTE